MSALTRWRARAARTRLRRPLVWLRHRGLDSSDVFLASYPRSGNTMLRFILGEVLSGVPSSFDHIQRIIPEIGVHGHARPLFDQGRGRVIKTHETYRREYGRAIYIVRDVRDVMLSSFARETALDVLHIDNLDEYVRPFMRGEMTRFGSWQEHVEGWMNSPLAKRGDLLVLSFEEMRQGLESAVARCLEFLGKKVEPGVIQNVIRGNSLEKMRAKEDRAKTLPKSPGEEGRWIGKGAIQGWQGKLTERQLKIVDEFAGELLGRLDYPRTIRHGEGNLAGHFKGDAFTDDRSTDDAFMDDASMDKPSRDRQGGADGAVLRN
jgi:estrone sulfotransferase